ncbi:MAG: DUF3837 family protein [Eubacterium sp.]|nr:DUF3837 family protein [Eubacterium sp.]
MVQDIARGAVIRKTQKDVNIITGNYEAAFAIGLLSRITGIAVNTEEKDVVIMKAQLMEQIPSYEPRNDREQVLIRMLKDYKPSAVWDEDVEAMFQRGLLEDADILTKESFFHR